ncbi:MAG: DNA gyrase [Parolsenella sp.]|uniref:DNA gyrase n=1 Tax=Parolsenella sp. TaxID=2083006 RepID=UPI002A762945|nr:DNA gyrase [Parolsenella sp.]MDY3291736.1 DNA gyrase [Parolsenella sp.]
MDEKPQKKNVYLSFHKNFVRESIPYVDKRTGKSKTFNQVTIPNGTFIDGKDMGGYEFSPLYMNESRFRGEAWRDIPLLADREVWLQKSVLDPEGNPVIGDDGKRLKDTVKVMPQQIKEAMAEARKVWAAEHGRDSRSLSDRAQGAKQSSDAMSHTGSTRQHSYEGRQ